MGADLGFFAEDRERDFPELNKCPDCETFFADDCCPLCGKECPEEFRAGNRKEVKQKKHRRPAGNGRVQFVPWYYSAWFIVLMLIFAPIVGIVLMWNSHWKKHWKIIVTVAIVLFHFFGAYLIGFVDTLFMGLRGEPEPPVNLELSEVDYRAACTTLDAEALYRNSKDYVGRYVRMECTVTGVASSYYYTQEYEYFTADVYLCKIQIEDRILEFFVMDYRQENQARLAVGDKITVWGEVAGELEGNTSNNGISIKLPSIYARFIDLQ